MLFQVIYSLSSNFIDKAYSHVLDNCVLTDNTLTNFDKARKRYSRLSTSPHVLKKIIRCHNNEYYKTVLSPIINQNEIEIKEIDLKDSFTIKDIRKKTELHKYTSNKELIEDLSRVLRLIDDGNDTYVIKVYDTITDTFSLKFVNDSFIAKTLKRIVINEKTNAHTILLNNLSKFSKLGVKFNNNDKNVISLFHGYKYKILEDVELEKIKMFLDLILEVIFDSNEEVYELDKLYLLPFSCNHIIYL